MQFNITQLPQYIVPCSTLKHAVDLKTRLKHVAKCAYKIWTIIDDQEYVFKYGETTQAQVERGYRQLWRIAGWPTEPATFAAGDDFDWVVNQFPGLDKNRVYITVYDISHVEALNPLCPELETLALEAQLIKEYVNVHGVAPIGNRKENSRIDRGLTAVKPTPVYEVLTTFLDFK